MIKSYYFLTPLDKFGLLTYLNRHETVINNVNELDALYRLPIYLDGKGALFFFEDGRIVASGFVILKEIETLKTAYIHRLECLDRKEDRLQKLVAQAKMVATYLKAEKVFVGGSEEMLEKLEIKADYRSLVMTNPQPTKSDDVFELEPVTDDTKQTYISVYEDSFYDMPHAATFDEMDLIEKQCFIVLNEKKPIGFMNFEVDAVDGFFDMGLSKAHQNQKLGTKLLQTAIHYLMEQNVTVNLTVIEKNERALKLYEKNGFVIKDVLNYWAAL